MTAGAGVTAIIGFAGGGLTAMIFGCCFGGDAGFCTDFGGVFATRGFGCFCGGFAAVLGFATVWGFATGWGFAGAARITTGAGRRPYTAAMASFFP